MNLTEQVAQLDREAQVIDRILAARRGEVAAIAEQARNALAEAAACRELAEQLDKACEVLGRYADAQQEDVRRRLEGLVTVGLRTVFEEDLTLHMRTRTVGRRTEIDLTLTSTHDGQEIETPIMDARGGGVAAVTGFLLQVILILLHRAPKELFLDETFAQVSAEYEPRLAEFMSELADQSGMQFRLVTHSSAFEDVSDAVYRTSAPNGVTHLERVK